jgi:hypothetical protein
LKGGLFTTYDDDHEVLRSQRIFLNSVWLLQSFGRGPTFCFLAFKSVRTGDWIECPIDWTDGRDEVIDLLEGHPRWEFDQYFCPNFFSEARRKRQYALPTALGWCDMDGSEPDDYAPQASIVWETSPNRFQALWAWDSTHTPEEAEAFSKALAYRHGGDQNGWTCTKMLRLIGSVNHKPEYDEPIVRAVRCGWRSIGRRPALLAARRPTGLLAHANFDVDPTVHDRADVIKRYSKKLHLKARTLMRSRRAYEPDRSTCLYFMILSLHEAGASPDEIGSVIWPSPYFVEKHGQRHDKLNEEINRIIGKSGR